MKSSVTFVAKKHHHLICDHVKIMFYKEHSYYIDSASGSLYDSKNPSPLAKRVLDFTLIKNGLNGMAGLAVYDGGNVEFIGI